MTALVNTLPSLFLHLPKATSTSSLLNFNYAQVILFKLLILKQKFSLKFPESRQLRLHSTGVLKPVTEPKPAIVRFEPLPI